MKILHIDETFHPAYGYHTMPIAKFQIKHGHEVYIAAPEKKYIYPVYKNFGDDGSRLDEQDKKYENETGVKIIRVPAKGYFLRRLVYGKEIFNIVEKVKPDVIYVHCVETLTAMRFIRKKINYPMMFDSHMLSMASKSKFSKVFESAFRKLITPKIVKNNNYVIRTQLDNYVNDKLGIPEDRTPFISFGTDTSIFKQDLVVKEKFRDELGISNDEFVVVYTGKLTESKGGQLLAEAFKKKFSKSVTLICVGSVLDDEYGKNVKSILDASENTVIMFPTQDYLDLPKYYQIGDLSVFPKQCSMSFYDAQACGLPVISENNNINVERCSHGNGFNFEAGSVDDFRNKIEHILNLTSEDKKELTNNSVSFIEKNYDYDLITKEYTGYLIKTIDNFNKINKEK